MNPGSVSAVRQGDGDLRIFRRRERCHDWHGRRLHLARSCATGDYTVQASAPNLVLPQPVKVTMGSAMTILNLQLHVAASAQQVTIRDSTGPSVSTEASNNASALVISGDALDALADDPDDLQADLQVLPIGRALARAARRFLSMVSVVDSFPPRVQSARSG